MPKRPIPANRIGPAAHARTNGTPMHDKPRDERIYGMCLACRSIEVELNEQIGTRDFSDIGESDRYPVGYGCEVCA